MGSGAFSYGLDGNRYAQTATFNGVTTNTTYVGSLFEVVSTSSSTEYRHNILADGEVIAVHTITGTGAASTSYLHYDHLGSVDAITNDQGSVIQTMSFDAFGQRRDASNWDYDLSQNSIATLKNYTDRGYTDQEQLDNLSLVDLNGRVYDPTVGRMISADPTVPDAFFSQAFNRYSYVYNSPLQYIDPSGYCADLPGYTCIFCTYVCGDNSQPPAPSLPSTNIPLPNGPNVPAPVPVPSPAPLPSPSPAPPPPQPPAPSPTPSPSGGNQTGSCVSYGCNSPDGGNNGVSDNMDSTDGAQSCDENCFALIAVYASPKLTDIHRDGPSPGGSNPNAQAPVFPQGLARQPGGGAMRSPTLLLGTLGAPQPRFEFISHVGVYGKLTIKVGPVKLNLEVNLASYNTPLSGQSYWSHGISLSGQVSRWELGFSWEQQSCDGGLSFQSLPSNFFLGTAHASTNGLSFEISPPQAFAGFTTGVVFPSSSASSGC